MLFGGANSIPNAMHRGKLVNSGTSEYPCQIRANLVLHGGAQ